MFSVSTNGTMVDGILKGHNAPENMPQSRNAERIISSYCEVGRGTFLLLSVVSTAAVDIWLLTPIVRIYILINITLVQLVHLPESLLVRLLALIIIFGLGVIFVLQRHPLVSQLLHIPANGLGQTIWRPIPVGGRLAGQQQARQNLVQISSRPGAPTLAGAVP